MNKELLFQPRCKEDEVELPGLGTFRVRGLTRAEIKKISDGTESGRDMEPFTLSTCLLDPELTEDEAVRWLAVAPFGEVEQLTEKINELSGIARYAPKEAYKSVHSGSGPGV